MQQGFYKRQHLTFLSRALISSVKLASLLVLTRLIRHVSYNIVCYVLGLYADILKASERN